METQRTECRAINTHPHVSQTLHTGRLQTDFEDNVQFARASSRASTPVTVPSPPSTPAEAKAQHLCTTPGPGSFNITTKRPEWPKGVTPILKTSLHTGALNTELRNGFRFPPRQGPACATVQALPKRRPSRGRSQHLTAKKHPNTKPRSTTHKKRVLTWTFPQMWCGTLANKGLSFTLGKHQLKGDGADAPATLQSGFRVSGGDAPARLHSGFRVSNCQITWRGHQGPQHPSQPPLEDVDLESLVDEVLVMLQDGGAHRGQGA